MTLSRTKFVLGVLVDNLTPQFGENFGDFIEEVIAVGATKGVDTLLIPARLPVVSDRSCALRKRHDLGVEAGIKEERVRQAAPSADVASAMRRRTIETAREAIQHVTDIADNRVRDRRR